MQIYGLFDELGELRYVGKTTVPLRNRLSNHLNPPKLVGVSHKNTWIKSILKGGVRPTIDLIQTLHTIEDLNAAEIYWIKFFRDQGCRLTNGTDGGDGASVGHTTSEETRRKISLAKRGRRHTAASRENMRIGQLGTKQSPETIAKRVRANTGKKRTPEQCARLGPKGPRAKAIF